MRLSDCDTIVVWSYYNATSLPDILDRINGFLLGFMPTASRFIGSSHKNVYTGYECFGSA
jgi:hypothetical protein